jgi:hypothetical protein
LSRNCNGKFDEVGARAYSHIDRDISSASLGLPKIDLAERHGAEA